jgi:hypothetical protein
VHTSKTSPLIKVATVSREGVSIRDAAGSKRNSDIFKTTGKPALTARSTGDLLLPARDSI